MAIKSNLVFYLDDELDICEVFYDMYNSDQLKVKFFTDPNLMIEALQTEKPAMIFMDYRMPGKNGDEVALSIDPDIPKVLVTGEYSLVTKYKFEKVINKPYSNDQIQQLLEKYCG